MIQPATHTCKYFLTAGECDAQGHMPMPLIATRLIEAATAHANILGIGYSALIKYNFGWVLSRLSIEMNEYPGINSDYSITTWIESINRRFSERNFKICDGSGRAIGYARSVWAAIDFEKRMAADLSVVGVENYPIGDLECPIAKTPRVPVLGVEAESLTYRFRYCDLDFNRHVNTVRYIELFMDAWGLDWYDRHDIARLDVHFHNECHFGETVEVRRVACDEGRSHNCELLRAGTRVVAAHFNWR